MLKLKSRVRLNLPRLFSFGLAQLFFLSLVEAYPANGQSANYYCRPYQGGYATLARSSDGIRPIIIWRASQQQLCNTVSTRFQEARDNGNLRFLVREDNLVCGTNQYEGECKKRLFTTDIEMSSDTLQQLLRNDNPIDGDLIYQSRNRRYFNLELYLERTPISANQRVAETR